MVMMIMMAVGPKTHQWRALMFPLRSDSLVRLKIFSSSPTSQSTRQSPLISSSRAANDWLGIWSRRRRRLSIYLLILLYIILFSTGWLGWLIPTRKGNSNEEGFNKIEKQQQQQQHWIESCLEAINMILLRFFLFLDRQEAGKSFIAIRKGD